MTAIVLDTETTGFSPHTDRVIEIAIVRFEDEEVLMRTYVDPQRPIPEEITKITGITDEMVAGQPTFAMIADSLAKIISEADAWIGYNPWFDRGMISGEYRRLSGEVQDLSTLPRWPLLVCAKRMWDIHEPREQRHLQNAYKRFVDRDGFEGAHGALADTNATLHVIRSQIALFGLHGRPWDQFDPDQRRWVGPSDHVICVDGVLIVNFGKSKGTPCHEIDAGYWRWLVRQDFPEHVKTIADFILVVKNGRCTAEELYSFTYGKFL